MFKIMKDSRDLSKRLMERWRIKNLVSSENKILFLNMDQLLGVGLP